MKKSDKQLLALLGLSFLFFGSFEANPLSTTTGIIGACMIVMIGSFYKELNKD